MEIFACQKKTLATPHNNSNAATWWLVIGGTRLYYGTIYLYYFLMGL